MEDSNTTKKKVSRTLKTTDFVENPEFIQEDYVNAIENGEEYDQPKTIKEASEYEQTIYSKIIQKKVLKTVKTKEIIKNPEFVREDFTTCLEEGRDYDQPERITVTVEKKKAVKVAKKVYKIRCENCSYLSWVSRIDAKYCSDSCRKQAYYEARKMKVKVWVMS
jgi:cell fate (sporulation/competence/biofilm development) regulator YlbF (YheA/YmcA/DUF963 family)